MIGSVCFVALAVALILISLNQTTDRVTRSTYANKSSKKPSFFDFSSPTVTNGKIIFLEDLAASDSSKYRELYTLSSNGNDLNKFSIEQPKEDPDLNFIGIAFPTFSFDGKKIAFLNCTVKGCSLFIMNSEGKNVKILSSQVDYFYGFSFNHDGKKILFRYKYTIDESYDYLINIETGELKQFDSLCSLNPKFTRSI